MGKPRFHKERVGEFWLVISPDGSLGMGNETSVASYDVWSIGRDSRKSVLIGVRPRKA